MSAFDELMAEAQAGGGETSPFESLMAEASAGKRGFRGGIKPTPTPTGPGMGEQLTDLARSAGGDVSEMSEFLLDTSQLLNPTDWGERIEAGNLARASTGEGGERTIMDRVTALPKFLYGAATHKSDANKRIEDLLETDLYDEQIPKGESPLLDIAKTGTGLAIDLGMTGFMGPAGRTVKDAVKTGAAMVGAGTAGELVAGTPGALTGVIMGALSREPKALATLGQMLTDVIQTTKSKGRALKRSIRSGDTLATASDKEIREGMRELLKNTTMPDGTPVTAEQMEMMLPRLRAALAENQKGTVGQLTDNLGVRQMEKEIAETGSRQQQGVLQKIDTDIEAGALQSIDDVAPAGVTERAPALPKAITEARQREAAGMVDVPRTARLEAEKADEVAGEVFKRADDQPGASSALAQSTKAAKDKDFNRVKKLWAKLDAKDAKIGADDLRTKYTAGRDAALKGDVNLINAFEADFPETVKMIAALEGDVSLEALSAVISKLSKESVGTSTSPAVINAVKESLYNTIKTGSKTRKAAANAYRNHMEKFGTKSTTGKALAGEPTDFGTAVITPNVRGSTRLNKLLQAADDPKVNAQAQDVLRSRFRDEAMVDGVIDPTKAAAFEKKYRNHLELDGMADLKGEVNSGVSTSQALRQSTADLTAAEKQAVKDTKALEKSDLGILGATGGEKREVIKAAERAMAPGKGKDVGGELKKLVDELGDNVQAKDDIRRAFADEFYNTVTDKGRLTKDGLDTFKQKRGAYEKSGLFTTKELDNIEKSLVDGQKLFMGDDIKKLAKLPPEKRRVAEAVAAIAGAKVGAYTFGSPLIGAAMGRKFAVEQLNNMSSVKARKLAFELSTNPDKYVKWIDKLNSPNIAPKEIDSTLVELFNAALAGGRSQAVGDQ